jgi:hypothetical protein
MSLTFLNRYQGEPEPELNETLFNKLALDNRLISE